MLSVKSCIRILIAALATCLVAACGGGGGGSSSLPATGVSITSANAKQVSAVVVDSVNTVEGATGGAAFLTGVSVTAQASDFNYPDFFVDQLHRISTLGSLPNGGSVTGVTIPPTTDSCTLLGGTSGTFTVSGNIDDPPVAGNSITVTYNSCILGTTILNGSMTINFTQVAGDLVNPPYTMVLTVSLSGFSVTDTVTGLAVASSGDMTMSIDEALNGDINLVLSGSSLSSSAAGVTETLSSYVYDILGNDLSGDFSIDLRGTIASTVIGGSVSFDALAPFMGNDFVFNGNPTAGELHITTSLDSSQAWVTAQNDGMTVLIEVDLDGDNIVDDTISTTWTELENL